MGEAEGIPLFFTLIPVLALLSNYDTGNCLINVGTEGKKGFDRRQILSHKTRGGEITVFGGTRKLVLK